MHLSMQPTCTTIGTHLVITNHLVILNSLKEVFCSASGTPPRSLGRSPASMYYMPMLQVVQTMSYMIDLTPCMHL